MPKLSGDRWYFFLSSAFLFWILLSLPISSAASPTSLVAIDSSPSHKNALFLEVLGKGGLWGLGYDSLFSDRFAAGATGSFYILDNEQVISFSPYLSFYPVISNQIRWFLQAGPQFIRKSILSPVPEWQGPSSNNIGGECTTGYEYRASWLFRAYLMASVGGSGIIPWLGFSAGWTF